MKQKSPKMIVERVLCETEKFRLVAREMGLGTDMRETWEIVEQKGIGGARCIALTEKNELIFVYEYRAAAEKYVLRFPTGALHEGENPKEAALREMEEETGFLPKQIEHIGTLLPTGGYFKGLPLSVFFASDLVETGKVKPDLGEVDMEVRKIPLQKAYRMMENLEFDDSSTIHLLVMLKKYLRDKEKAAS
ncbi:MAG: hypothetical protein A2748_01825 [Candidatus Wildermuthbacteria bacterium RIFCSPHIGHO2_01_FULL_45_20]|nr:MAG: hypothetical protein A2748_01825 [Candidatus Wildermuthbacteria bacterium RIFCSPHIGHO2_01_FULL_45_20]